MAARKSLTRGSRRKGAAEIHEMDPSAPMEARVADEIPTGAQWQYEPKWDGFRALVRKTGEKVDIIGKSGKSLARIFPEVVDAFARINRPKHFVLDGELIIEIDGKLSFEALQMRLHPAASRIQRLSKETPARFVAFDMLEDLKGDELAALPFRDRRAKLEQLATSLPSSCVITEFTRDPRVARRWLRERLFDTDGIVAKRLDLEYRFGERAMLKIKRMRTADCVVGGFRYAREGTVLGSLLLGLYDENGLLHHVGFTSSIPASERRALTARLEKLRAAPAFTGSAPLGSSRWATDRSAEWEAVKPKLVAEVRYDHVTGGRFRHGTKFLRWRPDKKPLQCKLEQIV
jgi:ATP-dependent DNA ligase